MKVSIILPVYNVEKYLVECMESAVNQMLKDIEIIAINDGSTDSSLDILKEYEAKYDFVKVLTQENKGLSATRNRGLKEAKGKYIYFLDSDDYIALNAMEVCFNKAEENNLDIITFDADVFADTPDSDLKVSGNYNRSNIMKSDVIENQLFFNYAIKNHGFRPPVWLNFYKREFLQSNNIEFYEGILHEDELHSLISFVLAKRAMYLPEKFFFRRVRAGSIVTSGVTKRNVDGIYTVAKESYKFYTDQSNNLPMETKENILKCIRKFYKYSIRFCDQLQDSKEEKAKIRQVIIDDLQGKPELEDKELKTQIKMPEMYYKIDSLKDSSKKVVKKLLRR